MNSPECMWEVSPATTIASWVEPSKGGMVMIPSLWKIEATSETTNDLKKEWEREEQGQDLSAILDDILGILADDNVDDGKRCKSSTVDDGVSNIDSDADSTSVGTQESVFETFDDVSVLTEESSLWNNVDADFGMEGDMCTYVLGQGTIFEHVLASLHWDKSEKSSKLPPPEAYMVFDCAG
jgi:hypothetical protein